MKITIERKTFTANDWPPKERLSTFWTYFLGVISALFHCLCIFRYEYEDTDDI
jgi:hypothetical protein